MPKLLVLPMLFIISSCQTFMLDYFSDNPNVKYDSTQISRISSEDYLLHLNDLRKRIKKELAEKRIKNSALTTDYLNKIIVKIISSNELIFLDQSAPEVFIFSDSRPIFFILPEKKTFFISSYIFKSFIRSEGDLVSLITSELIKANRNLYLKKMIIPTGDVDFLKILEIVTVPLNIKIELNKWAFAVLKRSGFDPYAYLYWLQYLNSSIVSSEWGHFFGSKEGLQEEYGLKAHLIKLEKKNLKFKIKLNSSKIFYSFIQQFREST